MPLVTARLIETQKQLTAMIKRRGKRRHPYFRPLLILKIAPPSPLIKTIALEETRHSPIHPQKVWLMPLALRKPPPIVSKAFPEVDLNQ